MSQPLVSVICLSYNHQPYVRSAILSVLNQSYQRIELIVVDDASTDGTQQEIEQAIEGKNVKFIPLEVNHGNCKAFNIGLRESRGEYIIDLAADDILLPQRIELGLADFDQNDEWVGVHFCDAFMIDAGGQMTGTHYARNQNGKILDQIPKGDVYRNLIQKYFICPPTMMIRRKVLDFLKGYDETLAYEDFDFWVRSSRAFRYIFNPAPLVQKRLLPSSLSSKQTAIRNKHQQSTLMVCEKIFHLNISPSEHQALVKRCWYEIRQCVKYLNFQLVPQYLRLIKKARKAQRLLSSSSKIDK